MNQSGTGRVESRPSLFTRLPSARIKDDDHYNPNPTKRRLYWLNQALQTVDSALARTFEELDSFPQNFRDTYMTDGDVNFIVTAHEFFPPSHRDFIRQSVDRAIQIAYEKGFRWMGALDTPREHKEIGSTIPPPYHRLDPDIPVGVLRDIVLAQGHEETLGESYSVSEADRGRRLKGRTRLDLPTGRITDEIDPDAAADSYFFLEPGRKTEVQEEERRLQSEVEKILPDTRADFLKSLSIITDLERYMYGEIGTPYFWTRYIWNLARFTSRNGYDFSRSIKAAKRIAFETGCWDLFLTPQEIMLRIGAAVAPRYLSRPYTPLAIQDGAQSDWVGHIRKGERSMEVTNEIFGYERPLTFRLEDLVEGGVETTKSPTIVDERNPDESLESDKFKEYFAGLITFPFARPSDWYFKSDNAV